MYTHVHAFMQTLQRRFTPNKKTYCCRISMKIFFISISFHSSCTSTNPACVQRTHWPLNLPCLFAPQAFVTPIGFQFQNTFLSSEHPFLTTQFCFWCIRLLEYLFLQFLQWLAPFSHTGFLIIRFCPIGNSARALLFSSGWPLVLTQSVFPQGSSMFPQGSFWAGASRSSQLCTPLQWPPVATPPNIFQNSQSSNSFDFWTPRMYQ